MTELTTLTHRRYVINRKCYTTEGYTFHNNLFIRTYPAPCRADSTPISHMLESVSITAWIDKIHHNYRLMYLGYGSDFAEAVWVRREETMLIYEDENFTIPIFLYDDHIEDAN